MKKTKEDDWRSSGAKKHLHLSVLSGAITDDIAADVFYNSHDDYKKFPFKNFKVNLNNLQERIKKDTERMCIDCKAYGCDRALLATFCSDMCRTGTDSNVSWHDSDACKFLMEDIANGKNKTMKPSALQKTRQEYMDMDLALLCGHLYQMVDFELKLQSKAHFDKKKKGSTFCFESVCFKLL
eukprot:8346424-Ditylum_brightwellii.AAC.1